MQEAVQKYYGETLTNSQDLQTNACCTDAALPHFVKPLLARVHAEVLARYYGCGLVLPELLEGLTILDLGCGAGRDVYVLSQLVGEKGQVIGVDMTEEQLAVARRHEKYHQTAFGYKRGNVRFLHGDIARLDELELADASVDLIVSNCVINLAPDKAAVLREAFRVLKPGGELYFSDVYSDRRIPADLMRDPVLYGECLSGALYWNDFLQLARNSGFTDPRLVDDRPVTIDNPALTEKTGNIRFYSATYRLFKLPGLELACEDHGQSVVYRGTIPHHAHAFRLDKHHFIETGRQFPVCGNTWRMLHDTRFIRHFDFYGDFDRHFGIFPGCGMGMPFAEAAAEQQQGGCC
ncbi:methyltransferase domain-containing protein [Nitrosomonas sp. sh817]|uniref:methyltransferase domain-containing protein n=1 Tax=Nitrosomonas sp. sh817 TaxID=3070658 RepID=UPI0027DD4C78|nr:methyltransferase domain-containing protein [Nitrosomonas sp. sh817]WMJ09174.1 methyltransferase domain-containing protein [Nitrosomonas sp. sh817]